MASKKSDLPENSNQSAKKNDGSVEDYSIEAAHKHLSDDITLGVTEDRLDLKMITKWFVAGTLVVTLIIIFITQFSKFTLTSARMKASEESEFEAITKLKKEQSEKLNSYGVIDLEKGIYHIPINQAIDRIAVD